MNYIKLLLSTSFFSLVSFSAVSQTKSLPIKYYKDKINAIALDSQFEKLIKSNVRFGVLTGYLKNDRIYLITEMFDKNYGFEETDYLFNKDSLVFVNKKQRTYKGWKKNKDSTLVTSYEANILFNKNMITIKKITGKPNSEFKNGDPIMYKENAAKRFLLITAKNKRVLLKKKFM